ncbi:MAG: hypothetical protein PHE21_03965, partial [Candidatus Dojkabacteria bacterium]|nr:hypothetical protein [Candidatus Dojkabacteria bacterium]
MKRSFLSIGRLFISLFFVLPLFIEPIFAISVIPAPTILGWNIKDSPTDSYSSPRPETELTCNSYTNINSASSHWTDVSGGDEHIKYQRQYRYNLGSEWTGWSGNEIYSEPYTNFRVFGSSTGNRGIYDTKIRAFYDTDGDNILDEGEPYSEWSSGCPITFDNTPPTKPSTIGFSDPVMSCGAQTNIGKVTVDWSDSTDNYALAGYDYFIDYPLVGGGRSTWSQFFTVSQYRGTLNQGLHSIKVRARDKAGNVSEWTDLCDITYDSIPPVVPIGIYYKDTDK